MSQYITSAELLSSLVVDLGKVQKEQESTILRWAFEAIMEMSIFKINPKIHKVAISESITLPKDFIGLNYVELRGSGAGSTEILMDRTTACVNHQVKLGCKDKITISIQNGCLLVSDNAMTLAIDDICIYYYASPLDENGLPMIPRMAFQAVKAYVVWMWAAINRRQHQGNASNQNPVSFNEVRILKDEWERECGYVLSKLKGSSNFYEALQIADTLHKTRKDVLGNLSSGFRNLVTSVV